LGFSCKILAGGRALVIIASMKKFKIDEATTDSPEILSYAMPVVLQWSTRQECKLQTVDKDEVVMKNIKVVYFFNGWST
jgi:hypothetical protein